MHLHPYLETPTADLVSQPWKVDIPRARTADVDFVELVVPRDPTPEGFGLTHPWFELEPKRIVSAVAGDGSIDRFPCMTIQNMPDLLRFWRLSVDGGDRLLPRSAEESSLGRAIQRGRIPRDSRAVRAEEPAVVPGGLQLDSKLAGSTAATFRNAKRQVVLLTSIACGCVFGTGDAGLNENSGKTRDVSRTPIRGNRSQTWIVR